MFRPVVVLMDVVAASVTAATQQVESSEELARRLLASGRRFLSEGRAAEGLKDLQRVVDGHPASSVADDALLLIAEYHLATGDDLEAARLALDRLISQYPLADTAPRAFVASGRLRAARASTAEGLEQAIADFERVRTLFPRSPVVASAMLHGADILRQLDRLGEAGRAYEEVIHEFPRSVWAARAWLGLALVRVAEGAPLEALRGLGLLQARFPSTDEASRATSWATILYRLHLRAAAAPPFTASDVTFGGPSGRLEDVLALRVLADGDVIVLQRQALLRFGPDRTVKESRRVVDGRDIVLGPGNAVTVVTRTGLVTPERAMLTLGVSRADGAPRVLDDLRAGTWVGAGHFLVADGETRSILRFAPDGRALGAFAQLDAIRLVASAAGRVAVIERGGRSVVVLDASGRPVGRVGGVTGGELREPVDAAWDALGNLYVLDRAQGAIVVVAPTLRRVATYAPTAGAAGDFKRAHAFDVDAQGRLFVHDDRSRVIRMHH